MEQRPLCAIIPTNGRKETSLVRSTNSLNRTLSRSPRGGRGDAGQSFAPHCKGGGGRAAEKLMDRSTNVCFCMISSVGVCFNDRSWAEGGPQVSSFYTCKSSSGSRRGEKKINWIYSVLRGALWWQLRGLTALFVMLSSPRSYSTKLQCCYQG